MNDGFLQVKILSPEQVADLEHEYQQSLLSTPVDRERAWQSLHGFFRDKNSQVDWQYQWSYWRWYTDLTWRRLGAVDDLTFLNIVIARQIPMALITGFNVWQELMFYLDRLIDPQLIENGYDKIRTAFFASEAVVGEWQKKTITVAELAKELEVTNQPGTDSLRSAEILAKVKEVFSQNIDGRYAVEPVDVVVDRFVGLVNFFLGVKPKDVWYVVDSFVNPEKYEQIESEKNTVSATEESVEESVAEQMTPKTNYADIKAMIEARFTRDASGEFTNLDGVLALLDSLATEQGDEQVRDLYYFDEGAGKFQWNEALLT